MTRSALALALLAAACAAALADARLGLGWFLDSPLVLLAPGAAGYAVGGWCRPVVSVPASLVAAAALTTANQLAGQDYHWLDDLVFFTVVVGGPAAAGAAVTVRARQVARLQRLQAELDEQHRIDVAAARLDEQVRIQRDVHARLAERIAAIAVRAEGAHRAPSGAALADIEAEARGVLDELRGALGALGPGSEPATPGSTPTAAAAPRPSLTDVATAVGIWLGLGVEAAVGPAARGPLWANALAAAVVAAPLVMRRRYPLAAVAAALVSATAMSVWLTPVSGTVTGVAFLVLVFYTIGAWSPGWWWLPGWLLASAGMLVLEDFSGLADDGQEGDADWVALLWAVGALALGRVTAGWQERVRRTEAVVAELEHGRGAAVRLAVAEQRQEVAGELHDTVAHAMTVVCLQAGASQATGHDAGQALATIARTASSSLAELRDGLDEIEGEVTLEPSRITALGGRMGVTVRVSGHAAAGRRTSALAQRVVREALVNVARHAPDAPARVDLGVQDGALVVAVSNPASSARPFPHGSGTGLAGLAAAVAAAGGRLESGPRPDGGFVVSATIPEDAP